MLQPFYSFRPQFIDRLIELNNVYLVSQTYKRGESEKTAGKTCILVTSYNDLGLAKIHLNAIKKDKYAAILDLNRSEHKSKLIEILEKNSNYYVYWAVIRSQEELQLQLNRKYKDNIRRYIQNRTDLRIGRETTLKPILQLRFGELLITLKFRSRELQIKFEDIEKS